MIKKLMRSIARLFGRRHPDHAGPLVLGGHVQLRTVPIKR